MKKSHKGERARFTREEDRLLKSLVDYSFGHPDWKIISQQMIGRSPRQCRERYQNYLGPNIIKRAWAPEEDILIMTKYNEIGPKWECISKLLTGRTGNDTRNRYLTITRKFKKEILNKTKETPNNDEVTNTEENIQNNASDKVKTSTVKSPTPDTQTKDDTFKQIFGQAISLFGATDECLDPFDV